MTLEIYVTDGRKGSNPGGKIRLSKKDARGRGQNAYLKHAYGIRGLPPSTPLDFKCQPIYEALSYEMARNIGVMVPEYAILRKNLENCEEVLFNVETHELEFSDTMHYYFISFISPSYSPNSLQKVPSSVVQKHMDKEKLDREVLFLADIEKKAQNYYWDPTLERLVYNDLGCNFVHAVDGFLKKPTGISRSEYKFLEKKKEKDCMIL